MNQQNNTPFRTSIGGQALMEGILMRGPQKQAIVCRTKDGLVEKVEDIVPLKEKCALLGLPIIRGAAALISSLANGMKALTYSAELLPEEMQGEPDKIDLWIEKHFSGETAQKLIIAVAMVLGVALSMLLFLILPTFLGGLIPAIRDNFYARTLVEGLAKMVIFFCYMAMCAKMPEIARVFAYHGAEHKCIYCYEEGLELTVENVRPQSRLHPRCGTSFMFVVIIISILAGAFIHVESTLLRIGIKFLLYGYSKTTEMEYDASTGKYNYNQFGQTMVDGNNGEKEQFTNVFVILADTHNEVHSNNTYHIPTFWAAVTATTPAAVP